MNVSMSIDTETKWSLNEAITVTPSNNIIIKDDDNLVSFYVTTYVEYTIEQVVKTNNADFYR